MDHDASTRSTSTGRSCTGSADVGRLKAEAAAEALAAFDSACRLTPLVRRLESAGELAGVVAGTDFVVASADWPAHDIERWTNRACFEARVPFISMSHSPPVARIGPLYVPGATGCFECQERAYRREYALYDEIVEQRRGRPSEAATLGPVCAFVGGQVALEALHQLTGLCTPATLGASYVYDLRTMAEHEGGRRARPGLPGLRVGTRPVPRGTSATCDWPSARLGPEARDVVACDCGSALRARFAPPPASVRGRTYVRATDHISAPATRPRPGAWHRRWSFGA